MIADNAWIVVLLCLVLLTGAVSFDMQLSSTRPYFTAKLRVLLRLRFRSWKQQLQTWLRALGETLK